jgi:glycine C-acetyltransferase
LTTLGFWVETNGEQTCSYGDHRVLQKANSMISVTFENYLKETLATIRESGQHKHEQPITSPQGPRVFTTDGEKINLCSNNYLGLANDPAVVGVAVDGLKSHGFGTASARFICGTHDLHRTLEMRIARFLGAQEAILYSSGFDANCGLFESFLGPEDCIISDELNHASIIDGVRLVKAQRKSHSKNGCIAMTDLMTSCSQMGRVVPKSHIR